MPVGLGALLGRAVLKRVESSPKVQEAMARSARTMPVTRAATKAAYTSLDDEAARLELSGELNADAEVIRETLANYPSRDDYIADRAYRLLAAAATGSAVATMPAERADLFTQEEEIGRTPMVQAFARLAETEPGLLEIEQQTRPVIEDHDLDQCGLPKEIRHRLARLVGGGARSDRQLLHTPLATSIVHQYLQILAGNARLGTPDVSYFDSPIKHFVSSHTLFDFNGRDRPKTV
jgi:hypothetical protein